MTENIYSAEMLRELAEREKAIRNFLESEQWGFERIALNLYWIYEKKMYRAMGALSISEYAFKNFGFNKSTTYNYIAVAERFGEKEGGVVYAGKFDERYKGYSPSKLSLLIGMTDKEIEESGITPEMSAREIKKAVKALKPRDTGGRFPDPDETAASRKQMPDQKPDRPETGAPVFQAPEPPGPGHASVSSPASAEQEGAGADPDGLVGYGFERVLHFNRETFKSHSFISIVTSSINTAFELHDHPETQIEINVRYPVFKNGQGT